MVAILTTKKTNCGKSRYYLVLYAALVRRNFAADLFAEKYDNRSQSKGNRTQSNFPKFSIFDWHSIDSIDRISIVQLRSIVFD